MKSENKNSGLNTAEKILLWFVIALVLIFLFRIIFALVVGVVSVVLSVIITVAIIAGLFYLAMKFLNKR